MSSTLGDTSCAVSLDTPTEAMETGSAGLLRQKRACNASPALLCLTIFMVLVGGGGVLALQDYSQPIGASTEAALVEPDMPQGQPTPSGNSTTKEQHIRVYLGQGCFWERQWAYFKVETDDDGPFRRTPSSFSAYVGYAGGKMPNEGGAVCYHTGDDRDYTTLGHGEAVQLELDASSAAQQLSALARDFFDAFTGRDGQRSRPDPMDRGAPYRSFVGLPGGMQSPLYATFAKENTHGMHLKEGKGSDQDAFNTVWVYDTTAFPFFAGEVYHQNHCNFFQSEGMPYPDSYTVRLWDELKASGHFEQTGCPEEFASHRSCGPSLSFR